MTSCAECSGTGFRQVKRGTVERCQCRQREIAAAMDRLASEPTGPDKADILAFVETLRGAARGRKRAIPARKLATLVFGIEHAGGKDRKLRALAHAATDLGHPIGTGNAGYWYCASAEELNETIGRIRSQAMRELARVRKLEGLRDQLQRERDGQVFDVHAE